MSSRVSLEKEVTEQLPWLFQQLGFRVVMEHFDVKNFGNSFVTLEAQGLRVRFVRDRGQVSAEVASCSEPETWWNLEHVCELIVGQTVEPGFELSSVAALLRNYYPILVDYLGPKLPETKSELVRRAMERKQAVLRRLSSQA